MMPSVVFLCTKPAVLQTIAYFTFTKHKIKEQGKIVLDKKKWPLCPIPKLFSLKH